MSEDLKKILTYLAVGVFFALTPYWALGQNINDLRNDLKDIKADNLMLSDEVDANLKLESEYVHLKDQLEQKRSASNAPSDVVEEAISILSTNEVSIESIKQEKQESSVSSIEIWKTYVYLTSSVLPSIETLDNLNSIESTSVTSMKSSLITSDMNRSELVLETIIVN